MKNLTKLFLILGICYSQISVAQEIQRPAKPDSSTVLPNNPFIEKGEKNRGYYGDDDRVDVTEVYGYNHLVNATVVMVKKSDIRGNRIYTQSLRDRLNAIYGINSFSSDVKFLNQPTCGSCTGFLIAPDVIATAGHCTEISNMCEEYVWIFDYTNDLYFNDNQDYVVINPNNVYECDDILSSTLNDNTLADFGFIRLNKKTSREPYRFRTGGEIEMYQDVYMIGAPTGLPLKLANNAYVYGNTATNYFKTSLDAFPGNSGGPVFDDGGWIEGILVRGDVVADFDDYASGDYVYDEDCQCITTVSFTSTYGLYGAEVQRIDWSDYDILKKAIYENVVYAIESDNTSRLDQWLAYQWMVENDLTASHGRYEWVAIKNNNSYALNQILAISDNKDITDGQGRTMMHYAVKSNNVQLIRELWDEGVSVSTTDDFGESAIHWAIDNGNVDVLKTVLDIGGKSKINTMLYGNTPLHRAVSMNNIEVANTLINNGADLTIENSDGCTPYKYAKELKHKDMKKFLKVKKKEMK